MSDSRKNRNRALSVMLVNALDSYQDAGLEEGRRIDLIENLLVGDALALDRKRPGVIVTGQEVGQVEVKEVKILFKGDEEAFWQSVHDSLVDSGCREKLRDMLSQADEAAAEANAAASVDITYETIDKELYQASHNRAVIAFFYSPNCTRCQQAGPILEALAEQRRLKLCRINALDQALLIASMRPLIKPELPTIRLYREGKCVSETNGVCQESAIEEFLAGIF